MSMYMHRSTTGVESVRYCRMDGFAKEERRSGVSRVEKREETKTFRLDEVFLRCSVLS